MVKARKHSSSSGVGGVEATGLSGSMSFLLCLLCTCTADGRSTEGREFKATRAPYLSKTSAQSAL